ncbi:hypothetical protein DPMN_187874 [Dreissena polymorpha]|uniref:Uncharacterized protein n=1 Tax=Dreissena polymorpha TaxID=45954 RepID=A0A9D4DRE8_DREPO|nr:hypothetical protein DPMN_187874 [Dreissena polymorpha]
MPRVPKQKACMLRNSYQKGHANVTMGKSFGSDSTVVQSIFIPLHGYDYQDHIS